MVRQEAGVGQGGRCGLGVGGGGGRRGVETQEGRRGVDEMRIGRGVDEMRIGGVDWVAQAHQMVVLAAAAAGQAPRRGPKKQSRLSQTSASLPAVYACWRDPAEFSQAQRASPAGKQERLNGPIAAARFTKRGGAIQDHAAIAIEAGHVRS